MNITKRHRVTQRETSVISRGTSKCKITYLKDMLSFNKMRLVTLRRLP